MKNCKESRIRETAPWKCHRGSWETRKSQEGSKEIAGEVNGKIGHYNVMEARKKGENF